MYIVNSSGIIHSIPDDQKLPAGARPATDYEAEYYEAVNSDCKAANAPKPEKKTKDAKQPAA